MKPTTQQPTTQQPTTDQAAAQQGLTQEGHLTHESAEEHLELRAKLRAVAAVIHRANVSPNEVLPQLTELRDQLKTHFGHEESHGLFSDVEQQAPWLTKRAQVLLSEHRNLLTLASDLLEGAQSGAGIDELRQDFQVLNRWLADHEQRENHLLLEAYDEDIGDKD